MKCACRSCRSTHSAVCKPVGLQLSLPAWQPAGWQCFVSVLLEGRPSGPRAISLKKGEGDSVCRGSRTRHTWRRVVHGQGISVAVWLVQGMTSSCLGANNIWMGFSGSVLSQRHFCLCLVYACVAMAMAKQREASNPHCAYRSKLRCLEQCY